MRTYPRATYFGVNQVGLRTSYGVAGRLGEVSCRFGTHSEATDQCRRLNRAYALGWKHAMDAVRTATCEAKPA